MIIVGGGAAAIFAAIAAKHAIVLEKSAVLLSKVRISGGGRCNVTHNCFDPKLLTQNYPRGGKELLGPFHRFGPRDTIEWFESRGVKLKAEPDGRIFPVTDRSETIIDCLLSEARSLGIDIRIRQRIEKIEKNGQQFVITLKEAEPLYSDKLILATGSSPEGHAFAEHLGHTIQKPVPSLFAFNIPNSPLSQLSGISVQDVEIQIAGAPFKQRGPLLITHLGFSGPAPLKLSAWGARYLNEKAYKVNLVINWLPELSREEILQKLLRLKSDAPQKTLISENPFPLPKNLFKEFAPAKRLADTSNKELQHLADKLHGDVYQTDGKTTNKDEFVTCGGVTLKEVDFKTMQSKICPGLYFAGEILDIDGVTGGFNFQNAWTTGFIAGSAAGE